LLLLSPNNVARLYRSLAHQPVIRFNGCSDESDPHQAQQFSLEMKTMTSLEFSNGDVCPALGLGTWKSDPGEVGAAVKEAIRLGYRHLDCAAIYGNEAEIGVALSELFSAGEIKRSELWITSKLWCDKHASDDVQPALQKTLADLQLDYLDLYLIHWPLVFKSGVHFPQTADDTIPLAELPSETTWRAMEDLVAAKLCRHIGVANFSLKKLKALVAAAKIKPAMNQIELHPYLQQPAMLKYCLEQRIHLTAYAPLGSAGRPEHLKAQHEPVLLNDPVIVDLAERLEVTPAQILLAWALQRGTAAIPKSTNPKRLTENLAAAKLDLGSDEMEEINLLDRNRRYFDGTVWAIEGSSYSVASLWDGE